jgi:hypothetical protein
MESLESTKQFYLWNPSFKDFAKLKWLESPKQSFEGRGFQELFRNE